MVGNCVQSPTMLKRALRRLSIAEVDDLVPAFNEIAEAGLLLGACFYAAMALLHLVVQPHGAGVALFGIATASALFLSACHMLLQVPALVRFALRWTMLAITIVVWLNSTVHLWITGDAMQATNLSMGVIIDNSGSMREKRNTVNQAALNLVRASNPHDEVFIVNFNDEYYLDQPFTNNLSKLKEALEKYETSGGTALYDAVVASADYLKKNSRLEKKVLFVVTDGYDNASSETLERALARVTEENGPTIYSLGLLGEEKQRRARQRFLRAAQLVDKKCILKCAVGFHHSGRNRARKRDLDLRAN